MTNKIEKKIVGYKVVSEEQEAAVEAPQVPESNIIQMHEKVTRPEALAGSTYKIKTPMSDHAMYLTISCYMDLLLIIPGRSLGAFRVHWGPLAWVLGSSWGS